MAGKVYLVGAGTGDPGLITVKGSRVLGEADAVFYGKEVSRDLVALARPNAEKCYTGPRGERPAMSRGAVRRQVIERARRGHKVVHLLPGDPMLFLPGADEALALTEAGVEFEIIPGIVPALAAATFAGIPLTHGGVSGTVTVVFATLNRGMEKEGLTTGQESTDVAEGVPASASPAEGPSAVLPESAPRADEAPLAEVHAVPTVEGAPSSPSSESGVVIEKRLGRSVVVRRRRPSEPATPVTMETPMPGVYLRGTELFEIIEDNDQARGRVASIEKPLMRGPGAADDANAEEEGRAEAYPPPDWGALARTPGTLLIVAAEGALPTAIEQLLAHGRAPETPSAMVRHGATNQQQSITGPLSSMRGLTAAAGIAGGCVLVVGESVLLRDRMNWFEGRPLFGYRIALTDLEYRVGDQALRLEQDGAVVHAVPLLSVTLLPDASEALLEIAGRINDYDRIVFSNPVTVRLVLDVLWGHGLDPRKLSGPRIVAIFPSTAAELTRYSLQPDIVFEEFPRRGLMEKLEVRPGQRVLIPRGARARDLLPLQIREEGAEVDIVPVYDTLPDDKGLDRLRGLLMDHELDMIVHATGAGLDAFWEILSAEERVQLISGVAHGCTGTLVARDLQGKGVRPAFELLDPTPTTLADAIRGFLAGRQERQQAIH